MNYTVELYGNTYIHQNPQSGSITAYQEDRLGQLHQIEDICAGMQVSQLSAAPDGRHFAFIAFDPDNPGKGNVYVYYLNTIECTMECATSWPTESLSSMIFFSMNSQYAIYTDGLAQLQVHSLYTDDPDKIYFMPSTGPYSEDESDWVFILGSDYLLWHMPSSHLAMIDLLHDGKVSHWTLTPSVKLSHPVSESWLHNDYLFHVNTHSAAVDIYYINTLEHTITLTDSITVPKCELIRCSPGPDSQSVTLNYLDSERRSTAQLVVLSH